MSRNGTDRFEETTVLITGSNYGIGKATAERFAREGANVVVTGRNEETGRETVDGIESNGGEATFIPANLADEAAIEALIDGALDAYDGLDILVNNAAAQTHQTIEETTIEDWALAFQVNLRAYWLTAKHARARMRDGGSIVNVSSNHAFETIPGAFPYNVTKTAINGLTRAMALEFAPEVRANTINSGWVPTGIHEVDDETVEYYRELAEIHPVGRMGNPEDVAGAVAFLASDDAAFITGTSLLVDGGRGAVMYDHTLPNYLRDGWPEEHHPEWF